MSSFRSGTAAGVKRWGPDICEVGLEFADGTRARGIVLEQLTGPVAEGDEVVANTTAVELSLGSGGFHFVLWNLSRGSLDTGGSGHIMKLRYTPLQVNVEAVEERLDDLDIDDLGGILEGMPVIAGELHSQLLPVALAYRDALPGGKLAYVMTDGGSLPAAFSNAARFLRQKGYLESVISCGHAFGGDLEAVTIHGALVAAKRIVGADAAVVLMGPGIVGTGSPVGFSGIEQGAAVNATASLGGSPIAIPRITFGDERERHNGLSHHTVAALKYGASARAVISLPTLDGERGELVRKQVAESGFGSMHDVREVDAGAVLGLLERCEVKGSVMGRGPDLEPEFFLAAGAAGLIAAEHGGGKLMDYDVEAHEVLSTERVFDGHVIKVYIDQVRLPDGRTATWERVAHPGAVGMVPLTDDGDVILVRQYRHAVRGALLEIPAGKLDVGEAPADCASRELAEEVGMKAAEMILLSEFYNSPGYSDERFFVYLARGLTPEKGEAEADEFLELVRVPLGSSMDLVTSGEIRDAKSIIGLSLARSLVAGELQPFNGGA